MEHVQHSLYVRWYITRWAMADRDLRPRAGRRQICPLIPFPPGRFAGIPCGEHGNPMEEHKWGQSIVHMPLGSGSTGIVLCIQAPTVHAGIYPSLHTARIGYLQPRQGHSRWVRGGNMDIQQEQQEQQQSMDGNVETWV